MSVLIKGMEKPTSCYDCRFSVDGWCYACVPESEDERKRITTNYCPLVPVPKHGDLIDRDKLRKIMFVGEQCLYSWDEIEDAIDCAPTIIPAEEGE
jgi:hypothetical protein